MQRVIVEYTPQWAIQFQRIEAFLKEHINHYLRIEHVGSTSVPGLAAKPVIDMDIEISCREELPFLIMELQKIGYDHMGDLGIKDREAFKRNGCFPSLLDEIDHHLYVCPSESEELKKHISFRDKLRSDNALMEEYKVIKYQILEQVGYENRAGYVQMKERKYSDFFTRVLES